MHSPTSRKSHVGCHYRIERLLKVTRLTGSHVR